MSVDKLGEFHDLAKDEARRLFNKQHFGKHHAARSILKLDEEIKKVSPHILFIFFIRSRIEPYLLHFVLAVKVCIAGCYRVQKNYVFFFPELIKYGSVVLTFRAPVFATIFGIKVPRSFHQGVQQQALQLARHILPGHGCRWALLGQVLPARSCCVVDVCLPRDIHEAVLVVGVPLLQPRLARDRLFLGNRRLQPPS